LPRKITLPAWRCLRYEVAINGMRILKRTVNDFSLWRLIEYPQTASWLDAASGDLILDIGSGTSSFGQMLAREGARVVVVDLSRERVEWQRNKAQTVLGAHAQFILPVVADATALPFRAGAFNRVTSVSALEHVPDDRHAASEIGRVMKDGAVAVISVPYTFDERKTFFDGLKSFERVEKNTFVQAGKNGYQVRFYSDEDIKTRFAGPAHSRIERVSYFGRKILNDWYHETALNKYWLSFILKDYMLALTIHPFEEKFLRKTEPFGVIFRMRKDPRAVGAKSLQS
jgi:SAM-dependent methyltransferase